MIYIVCTVLRFALKVGVLVSVLWQDRDQDTNLQGWGQDQDVNFQDQDRRSKKSASRHHIIVPQWSM